MNVFCDSQSVIHLVTNPTYHIKMKHIDVRYHFVRHVIDGGKVTLKNIHTQENHVDMFAKPILVEKMRQCLASWLAEEMMNGNGKGFRKIVVNVEIAKK